jgi:glycosyltransferase involved in cell wall biosynthesis
LNVFENNEGYYLYFGRLSREKGLSNLVQVFNETTEKLKIVGEGPELNKLKIISLSHIEFLGSKNKIELKQLISKSKFIVIPSIMFENNPLSIVESFALGKPVIGSKIGGITELLENNRGILFDSGNNKSLLSAINKAKCISEKDYKTMCDKIKDFFSNNLSESIHYKNLISIYDKVLNV